MSKILTPSSGPDDWQQFLADPQKQWKRGYSAIAPHNPLISFTLRGALVPGGGIEPPTRGFSIRCSTPELPGQG